MKKRILSIMLTAALILTSVPMMTFADAGDPVYYGKDNYVYELSADPDTGTVPTGFGTSAYNGKIWTDKSVAVNTSGTGFDVNLKALAQEYVSTSSSSRTQETLADVLFILDFTTSMNTKDVTVSGSTKETRIEALIDAFNEAADIICANGKNRISVYGFGGRDSSATTVQMLTLGNYTPGSNGKYLSVSSRNNTWTISTVSGLKKDNAAVATKSQKLISYTSSQHGIANSATGFISDINNETSSAARKPYVIFMTDGAATDASKQYDNTAANIKNPANTYDLTTSDYTNGDPKIAAATILAANVWKDKIQAAYDSYNTKNGHDIKELDWFNIGLSIGTDIVNARAIVDPAILEGHTQSSNGDSQGKIKYYMNEYENNNKVNSSTPDYYKDDNYQYYTHDYVYFCDTTTLLNSAFEDLARLVESESAAINIPIVTNEASGDVSSDMVFKDYIGKGMEADGFSITVNGSESVIGKDDDSDGIYTFEGYEATVTVTTEGDNQLVEWNLPATELAMFTFKDRRNLNNGEYESATPSVLSYSVKLKDGVTLEDYTDYSTVTNAVTGNNGARTTVEYSVPGDNTYYFDVVNTTDEEGKIVFDNSTLKTSISENLNKTSNITSTATAAREYNYDAQNAGTEDSLCNVTGTLGNNGKIKLILKTEKTVDKTESATNKTVTYTTTVTNFSDDKHDVTLEDIFNTTKTDTTTTTNQDGTVDGEDTTDITKQVTVTGNKDDIINGNDPIVKFVDDYVVNYDEGEGTPKSNDDLDVKIIEPRFKITYEWTNAPSSANLPTDSDTYVETASFPVDSTYTSSSKVETKNSYGNVTERWTFSGWNSITIDDQGDAALTGEHKMPESDITIHGTWTHTDITPDKYNITYVFDGDYPEGRSPATDGNDYEQNQPFGISEAPYSDVNDLDDYGNLKGIWSFDGWDDITIDDQDDAALTGEHKMPASDITIHGTWTYTPQTINEYGVTYVFDKFTGGTSFPSSETSVPTDANTYVNGQTYNVANGDTSDIPVYDDYGNKIGTWSFEGWYKTTKDADSSEYTGTVIPASDVTIHGKWSYTQQEIGTHSVIWVFDGEAPEADLPAAVSDLVNGQDIPADETFKTGDTHTDYTVYGNPEVIWTFNGWYKTTVNTDNSEYTDSVMPDANLTIHGKWTKTPQTVEKYNVSYVFDGEAPSSAVPPEDSADYENNQPYTVAGDPETVTEYDEYGNVTDVWTFDGWNKTTKNTADGEEYTGETKIPGADLVIHGTWIRDKKEVPTHTVTVPEDPQDPESPVIEKEVTNGATIIVDPNSGIWEHDGETYDESTNITVEEDIDLENPTKEGHTFTGWDITVTDDGIIKYTAEWDITNRDVTFTPTEDGGDPEGEITVPKGSIITIDPNKGDWTHGGETYTDKTTITIDDDTVIEDPTRKGYEFTGWEKTVDEDGNITLTATWERDIDISKYIVPTAIIGGGITAGAIAGGITTAIVAGSIIGVPAVIIGGAAIYKAIKDNQSQDNTETEPSDIPYTGSDITVTLMASAMAIISMVAAAYIILENKKKRQSAE